MTRTTCLVCSRDACGRVCADARRALERFLAGAAVHTDYATLANKGLVAYIGGPAGAWCLTPRGREAAKGG